MRTAVAALFAAGLAILPISAKAQYYYCDPFPLAWPFCIAGAAVGTAAAIATAPLYALSGGPYYYYYGQPYYYSSGYYYPARRYYTRRAANRAARASTRAVRPVPRATTTKREHFE